MSYKLQFTSIKCKLILIKQSRQISNVLLAHTRPRLTREQRSSQIYFCLRGEVPIVNRKMLNLHLMTFKKNEFQLHLKCLFERETLSEQEENLQSKIEKDIKMDTKTHFEKRLTQTLQALLTIHELDNTKRQATKRRGKP